MKRELHVSHDCLSLCVIRIKIQIHFQRAMGVNLDKFLFMLWIFIAHADIYAASVLLYALMQAECLYKCWSSALRTLSVLCMTQCATAQGLKISSYICTLSKQCWPQQPRSVPVIHLQLFTAWVSMPSTQNLTVHVDHILCSIKSQLQKYVLMW